MDPLDISGEGLPEGARGAETRSVVALRRGLAILDAFSADRRELGVNELGCSGCTRAPSPDCA
jgi:hypothetical protein